MVLLHGGLVTGELMWSSHVPALAENYRALGIRHPASVAGLVLGGVVVEPSEDYLEALREIGSPNPERWTSRRSRRRSAGSWT